MSENSAIFAIFAFGQRRIMRICSSYLMTVPKEWAKLRGITENDCLEVFLTSDDDLLLRPMKESVEKNG